MEKLIEHKETDEIRSVPTEILVEFLTSVMLKDYEIALRHCTQILIYEPNNLTAKKFYPLIVKKLQMVQKEPDNTSESSESDSTYSASDHDSFSNNVKNKKSSSSASESDSSVNETKSEVPEFEYPTNSSTKWQMGNQIQNMTESQENIPKKSKKNHIE